MAERTNERILGDTRHRRQGPSNTRHTPTRHQTPPEPSPKPLLTYALTPPAPRYPHSRHLPLLPPPLLPVELPTPLSLLSPLSPLNPLNLQVAYVIYFPPYFASRARVPMLASRSTHPRRALAPPSQRSAARAPPAHQLHHLRHSPAAAASVALAPRHVPAQAVRPLPPRPSCLADRAG